MPSKTLGANPESLNGPGTITHEGGDAILIADVEGGLPGTERTLIFEGNEVVIEGDDEFKPSPANERTTEIGEAVVIRALGQANYSFNGAPEPDPEPEEKPKAKPRKKAKSA